MVCDLAGSLLFDMMLRPAASFVTMKVDAPVKIIFFRWVVPDEKDDVESARCKIAKGHI